MNETMWVASQIVVGFGLLMWGGELLVRGAAAMASSFRISPLVIGLTVVAFGTSAPELGVSLQAALSGNADVAVGNVVGSNIINVLLILGAAALVTPLIVSSQLIRLDVPLMIAASLCMWAVAADGVVERWEGALLFVSLILYIFFCIRKSRSENKDVVDEFASEYSSSESPARGILVQVGLIVAGLVLLGLGSNLLVAGAITVAESLHVSQLVIGLTIVALGTSLPEMVTSVVASFRGQRDIAVGNIVGSNLFNILGVLGLTSAVSPTGVSVSPSAIQFDIPVMVGIAVLCYPVFVTGAVMRRWEGGVFVIYYVTYTTYIVLHAIKSPLIAAFKQVVVFGIVPLTVLACAVWIYQTLAARRRPEADDGPSEPS